MSTPGASDTPGADTPVGEVTITSSPLFSVMAILTFIESVGRECDCSVGTRAGTDEKAHMVTHTDMVDPTINRASKRVPTLHYSTSALSAESEHPYSTIPHLANPLTNGAAAPPADPDTPSPSPGPAQTPGSHIV